MTDRPLERLEAAIPYPCFNPAFVPVERTPDVVEISVGPWTGPSFTLQDPEKDGRMAALIDQLDGDTHVSEIIETLSETTSRQFAAILLQLADEGVVYDAASRGDGNWAHYTLRKRFRQEQRDQLDSRTVLVVSCGRVGRQIADDLAMIGVGEVGVIEPISAATRDRQYHEDVVKFSADSLTESIVASDFVAYGADRPYPSVLSEINEITQECGTPWSIAQIHGFDGFVGPTVFPGETACYRCFCDRTMANVDDPKRYRAYLDHMVDNPSAAQLRLPGLARMVAGYLIMDVVHLLAFGTGFTRGRTFVVDGLGLSIECNDVLKRPRCGICGKEPGDDVARFSSIDDVTEAVQRFGTGGDR